MTPLRAAPKGIDMRQTKPKLSILDKRFVYRNAAETDVAATFRRIRREMARQPPAAKVTTLRKVAAK